MSKTTSRMEMVVARLRAGNASLPDAELEMVLNGCFNV